MPTRAELLVELESVEREDGAEVAVRVGDLGKLYASDLPEGVGILPCSRIGEDGTATPVCDGTLVADATGLSLVVEYLWWWKQWEAPLGLAEYLGLVKRAVQARQRTHGDAEVVDSWADTEVVALRFSIHVDEDRLDIALRKALQVEAELREVAEAVTASIEDAVASAAKRLDGWGTEPLDDLVDAMRTGSTHEKGLRLEELTSRLFQQVPGFRANGRVLTETEEIDIRVSNGSDDPLWRRESALLLVECKNWSTSCGREQFSVFKDKLRGRVGRVSCGFLVSWNGFAHTVEKQMLRGSEGDLLVVPITGEDIRAAVRDDDFAERLRALHEQAVLL
jgi:hypothetical protein